MKLRAWLATLTLCFAASIIHGAEQSAHVVMISIDGMMPFAYTKAGPSKIPTIRRLTRDGAYAEGVIGVLPSVTYPSHTTLISGVLPAVHGIVDNHLMDPENRSHGGWFWYARDIKAMTLLNSARAHGLRTASVMWPVTVGAGADLLLPEYDRSEHPENLSLVRALSTPNFLEAVEIARKKPFGWPFSDREPTDTATFVIRTYQPHLTLVHLVDLDSAQHEFGPGSPQALDTLEKMDGDIAEILKAVSDAGITDNTIVAVVSDHGFLATAQALNPNAVFKEKGWLHVGAQGAIDQWRAYFLSSGGSGFVYLKDPGDQALRSEVGALLQSLKADTANGIESVWSADDLRKAGAHPDAAFGIDMRNGFTTGGGHGALLTKSGAGGHGFAPSRPELHASLVLSGPPARGVGSLGVVRMTQIAPTLARWLGVDLSKEADEPLTLAPRAAPRP